MTSSTDLSVDELLLLQENQYHVSNYITSNVKPIGSERKIGQVTNPSNRFVSEIKSSLKLVELEYNNDSSILSEVRDDFRPLATAAKINHEMEPLIYHSYPKHSFRSATHGVDSFLHPQKFHPNVTGHVQTVNPTSFFRAPHSSTISRYHHSNSSRSIPPVFTHPFQCTRERFQVNSVGRPILRNNNYHHALPMYTFKIRR
ncbi:unnamed protein product [Adineta ricciae]|uniref:Uncharacterized protein n=1 Tax=Adineta ricciae TaxID=249248 RepID=A0A815QKE7_ADIRI|nr:unnamed protein product [Adineta ricciae]